MGPSLEYPKLLLRQWLPRLRVNDSFYKGYIEQQECFSEIKDFHNILIAYTEPTNERSK